VIRTAKFIFLTTGRDTEYDLAQSGSTRLSFIAVLLTEPLECTRHWRCWLHRCVAHSNFVHQLIVHLTGSHVIYVLQKTRRYRVISLDNHHNSNPASLECVAQLSKSELPENPSEEEKLSAEIDVHNCDLTNSDQVRAVFEKYGKGGIWGVIHIAVSFASTRM